MRSRRLVSAIRWPLFSTRSVERADRSFFIWGSRGSSIDRPYTLSTLGILNGFLKHRTKRLVVRGDTITLEQWPPPKDET